MATADLVYLALIAVALAVDHLVIWPRFLRNAQVQPQRARLRLWWAWMGMLWVLAAAGVALWLGTSRGLELLGLNFPTGWRLWTSSGLVLLLAGLYLPTIAKIARGNSAQRTALRARFGNLVTMLPRTQAEISWFVALSVTAGVCEEFVFRGYLIWVLHPFFGLWGAAAVSLLVFAAAHAYQGAGGALKSGLLGALLTAMVIAFGSLLPAIALHALIDIASGVVAWLVLREVPGEHPALQVEDSMQHAQVKG
jgi:membrane protease YdiL (CAAX protease family)